MKAALELGRWTFLAPIGYLNAPRAMGKSLMADPERAPLVRRAFEEYATGRFTKQQVLEQARAWGLTNRRNRPLTSQAIGVLLRNQLYAGIVDVPEYGVRAKRGDFEPLISEDLFYRVQSVLSGRVPSTADGSGPRTSLNLNQRRCRLANATPEPDFRYRSNAIARFSSLNSMMTSACHGRPFAVCVHLPEL